MSIIHIRNDTNEQHRQSSKDFLESENNCETIVVFVGHRIVNEF